ncbi:hypothetical protein HPB50_026772 [Hyalomma asiaticum]|uniref:Uncharacterized protein n=1 Tax=Hyalomma asiaticum TaxID=266040 RepID=A0ACB7SR45_HYAAI|nr:hypothetical protein HPB50_026772 [Hyalomma asiaticum]
MAAERDLENRPMHRVTHSVSGVNWRPTRFVDAAILNRYACSVCHVLPRTSVLLPCSHVLCRRCQGATVDPEAGSVCPQDGRPFRKEVCQELRLPNEEVQDLRAYCWNEVYGCDFVGPLGAVLRHYETECAFHSSPCQQCGEVIVNAMLPAHYFRDCSKRSSQGSHQQPGRRHGTTIAKDDAAASRPQTSERVRRMHEAQRVAALQRHVNALEGLFTNLNSQVEQLEEEMKKAEGRN